MAQEKYEVTDRVTLYDDGKYRWVYKMNLFKKPTIFFLICKVMLIAFGAVFVFVSIIDLFRNDFDSDSLLTNLKIFGIVFAVIIVIAFISYLIYAAIMGGNYIVVFTMDQTGILHEQTSDQARKAKKIGAVTAAVGALSGNLSTMAAGMNATRTTMYSEFARVKKVKTNPRRGVIKVNQTLSRNQVYVCGEDFEFVKSYILGKCENLKK
ncbi:MAG: hypothetical protein IKR26_01610 [Lachnospiraceae bacterium]|nr:hypothetical protein [Lachnospiraceae bacterium]